MRAFAVSMATRSRTARGQRIRARGRFGPRAAVLSAAHGARSRHAAGATRRDGQRWLTAIRAAARTPPRRPASAASGPPRRPSRRSKSASRKQHAARGRGGAAPTIAGGPTADDASMGAESPELRALREAERELFPPAIARAGQRLAIEPAAGALRRRARADVDASGVPPAAPDAASPQPRARQDLSWLAHLEMPDLPVRWDARVVRYLEFFRDDPARARHVREPLPALGALARA